MKINVKIEKGITLMILIITVIVLLILAGVSISVSRSSLSETKKYNFASELELIEQKMRVINKEIDLGSTAYENIGTKYDDLDNEKKVQVESILLQNNIEDYSNYRYMSKEDLLKIGLKNIEQNVIIGYGKSEVYSYNGIKINNNMCYSLYDISKL